MDVSGRREAATGGGPKIWVTSVRRGAYLRAFTPPSPEGPPPLVVVYVGRAVAGWQASPLANPFRLKDEEERGATIERYREWLQERLRETSSPQSDELRRILALSLEGRGVALGCWCAPNECHGQVIRDEAFKLWRSR